MLRWFLRTRGDVERSCLSCPCTCARVERGVAVFALLWTYTHTHIHIHTHRDGGITPPAVRLQRSRGPHWSLIKPRYHNTNCHSDITEPRSWVQPDTNTGTMPERRPFVRLPTDVYPVNYELWLKPDLIDFTFEGRLEALVEVRCAVDVHESAYVRGAAYINGWFCYFFLNRSVWYGRSCG